MKRYIDRQNKPAYEAAVNNTDADGKMIANSNDLTVRDISQEINSDHSIDYGKEEYGKDA
jgi:hypothetical protein